VLPPGPRFRAGVHPLLALTTALCAGLGACNADVPPLPPDPIVVAVNGYPDTISVDLLGVYQRTRLFYPALAPGQAIETSAWPGTHILVFGSGHRRRISLEPGRRYIAIAVDSSGPLPVLLIEPDTAVPGTGRLRLAHLATTAPRFTVWTLFPDSAAWTRVVTTYRDATVFRFGNPGWWRVWVESDAPSAAAPDTLALTEPFLVPDGESRTVLLLDDPNGGVIALVVAH
jgi:hypothetical protein